MKCNNNENSVSGNCGCDFGAKIFGSCNTSKITLDANKPETLNWTEISVPEILNVPCEKPDIEHIDQVHAKAEVTCVKLIETPYLFDNVGVYDVVRLTTNSSDELEISEIIAENAIVFIQKPDNPDQLIITKPNEEGTCLTGRKLIVEGILKQKVVYTADVDVQSVHSAHYEIPFSAFIIPYAKVEGEVTPYESVSLLIPGDRSVGDVVDEEEIVVQDVNVSVLEGDEIQPDLCEDFCVDAFIEDIYITPLDCRTIFKNVTLFLKANPLPQCGEES
ncbi:hypothetical protein TPELB_08950 [Terrisporobacter petrolearius]|uniref:SipL SPOCS domain-containing protein n=1 Tax=Terrisporobacter petrolearius TaxID=1460447 RepID=A0ABZ3FCS4_9FIRM